MTQEQIVYFGVVGAFRTGLTLDLIAEVQEAMNAIRCLPYKEEAIMAALGVLGAGVAADIPMKDISI